MRSVIFLVLLFALSSCGGQGFPGHISELRSQFDGRTELHMEPAWLYDSQIKLGLFWNTSMPESELTLDLVVKGAHTVVGGESLLFNIDGEIVGLKSFDKTTDRKITSGARYIPPSGWSSKRYKIGRKLLTRLVSAKKVFVRVRLGKNLAEGEFSRDDLTTARPAFREFLERMDALTGRKVARS